MDDKIGMAKFGVILLRIIYGLAFILSLLMFMDTEGFTAGLAFGIVGVVTVITVIFIKLYIKKLEKEQNQINLKYQEKVEKTINQQQKLADDINKNNGLEIDENKIIFSELDKQRIMKNCNIMKKYKLPYQEQMKLIPFDAIVKVKSKEEIAIQMIEDFIIAQKAPLNKGAIFLCS